MPGGDFPWDGAPALRQELQRGYPFLAPHTVQRFIRSYGTLATDMLGDARIASDMGRGFGADLTEREVAWLMRTEWARTAEDVLWRRSKLGLRVSGGESEQLDGWMCAGTASVNTAEAFKSIP